MSPGPCVLNIGETIIIFAQRMAFGSEVRFDYLAQSCKLIL